ncbi:methionine gamma-lyase [Evansella sp. AB-rgal1]|uniref:methionine gamma-lyase n=1 Tax=Evansella sp. AB-rgal1 TaxID=3242696 RepID=UPI00359DEF30
MESRLIHSFFDRKKHFGSLAPPLYQTSTFVFDNAEQGELRFSGNESGYMYSRLGNPTVNELEKKISDLEDGEAGAAFGSGMAAVSAVLFALLKSGDHVLVSEGVYGCTFGLLGLMKDKFNVGYDLINMNEEKNIESAMKENTKVIYVETPINPTMKLVDLELITSIAKRNGITVVVDNTFCSPYLQQPIHLGADIVVHSATKYIGGHGDVIAGLVVGSEEFIQEMKLSTQKDIGGIISPFDAWLLLRGLKTLAVRMDRHCDNAHYLFSKLKQHPNVQHIVYPGDGNFEQYELARRQMKHFGGLLSFEIKGGKEKAQQFMNSLRMIKVAVSLGDAETLIQHPATMTHSVVPTSERERMGITDSLVRLSVGLEKDEDIWSDIEQALEKIG